MLKALFTNRSDRHYRKRHLPVPLALLLLLPAICVRYTFGSDLSFALQSRELQPDQRVETIDPPVMFAWTLYTSVSNWLSFGSIAVAVYTPDDAPPLETLAFLKDRDGHWYQHLASQVLNPGSTNVVNIPFAPDNNQWQAVNHDGAWHYRARLDPASVGVRVFGNSDWEGKVVLVGATGIPAPEIMERPPTIANVRSPRTKVGVRECFEVRFDLPDRYADPFDQDAIDVWAEIVTPDGKTVRVDAFYYQDFYRRTNPVRDTFSPQGRPHWRVRYAPRAPGAHVVVLRMRDHAGAAYYEGPDFVATESPAGPPFIRVSKTDPRFFEGCDGSPFFAIGHNIRSPHDTRMNDQFPFRYRHEEGSRSYARRFRDMRNSGENMVEVWMAAWSLGLEWTPQSPGYHGIGDYNLIHAWELDEVLEQAARNDIYVNLALINHGRFSIYCDPEWNDNPLNSRNGGYLEDPMDFFTNPQAIADYRRQLRYIVARWGWSPNVFAWKLFNEINLIGQSRQRPLPHHDPRVLKWLADTGDYLDEIDPNQRMVGCHLSNDYKLQHADMLNIPQLDFAPIDAYHSSANPLHIVQLIRETAAFNNPFGKPVLITEFGGSPMGNTVGHLRYELRAGLWSSTAAGVAGTPMFWWWHLIEEANLYPVFESLSRYMEGEDRRDPELKAITPAVLNAHQHSVVPNPIDVTAMASTEQAYAYLAVQPAFQALVRDEGAKLPSWDDLTAIIPMPGSGQYRVTFWDIDNARPLRKLEVRASDGKLSIPLPSFELDLPFKLHRID